MSREHLLEGLRRSPVILKDFVAAIPRDALEKRRREGCWTIYEHLLHLVETQEVIQRRLELIRDNERALITPFVPKDLPQARGGKPPAEDLVRQFTDWRQRQLGLIEAAPEALWRRQAEHPEYERYGFEILVRHALLHDGQHLARIEELWLYKDEFVTVW